MKEYQAQKGLAIPLAVGMLIFVVLIDQCYHSKALSEHDANHFQDFSHVENEIKDNHQPRTERKIEIYEQDKRQLQKETESESLDNPCVDNPLAAGCPFYEAVKDLVAVYDSKFGEYVYRLFGKKVLLLPIGKKHLSMAKGMIIVSVMEEFDLDKEINRFKDHESHVDNEIKDHRQPHKESKAKNCEEDKLGSREEMEAKTSMDNPCLLDPFGKGCLWDVDIFNYLGTEEVMNMIQGEVELYLTRYFRPYTIKTCMQRIVCEVARIFKFMPNAKDALQYWIEEKVSRPYLPIFLRLKKAAKNPGDCESMPCDAVFKKSYSSL